MADLFSKFDPIIEQREALLAAGLTDPFNLVMEKVESPTVALCNGKRTILLGTYNYMGMTFDPDVVAAGKTALDEFGSGTTGSRVLNGTYAGHRAVEQALKDFYAMDHAMVFSTGYQANLGVISTIAGKDDYIILDIDSHASIYDGCALGNAQIVPFRHNDVEALDKRLKRLPPEAGKLVILEGVYSMLGDIAPLNEMVAVSKAAGAMVLVDEAHSMGFIGEHGRGVAEAEGVMDAVDFIIGTFSKSVGTVGGFCVSNHPRFEILHQPQSAIIAVIMPDLATGAAMWEALLDEGLYVNLARPPATPANMTLLRCSLCALHSEDQVGEILGMFAAAGRATGCID